MTFVQLKVDGDPQVKMTNKKTGLRKGDVVKVLETKTIDSTNYYGVNSKRGVIYFEESEVSL